MSLRSEPADEVHILTGGVDLFSLLYARAQKAYPRGIWVEAFGTVKGASIIELTGDRHRESVREATLSQMSATVFSDGDTPDIRSVATLTWRDKRTPKSLTGFLASSLAVHVTVRIREIVLVDGLERPTSKNVAPAEQPSRAARVKEAQESVSPRDRLRDAQSREDVDAAVQQLAVQKKAMRAAPKSAEASAWDALREEPSVKASAPVRETSVGWGDVAKLNEEDADTTRVQKNVPSKSKEPTPAKQQTLDAAWGSWEEVAQVSEEVALRPKTAASALKRGEVLVHPTLGNCTILAVVSETVVMVKPKHDTSRKISLKPFEIYASKKPGIYELERR